MKLDNRQMHESVNYRCIVFNLAFSDNLQIAQDEARDRRVRTWSIDAAIMPN